MTTQTERVSDERLRELLAGCEGVTPGPWELRHDDEIWCIPRGSWIAQTSYAEANAAHIAACDPDTIRSLVSELLALREAVKPFADFISNDTNNRLPDEMPLTVGSQMARRQVTVRQFRSLVNAAGGSHV